MAGDHDAFAEQQAALNAPPPPKWRATARSIAYAVLLFLIFGVACGQMGIWSYFLQSYGNIRRVQDYPNRETMQTGNMLFANSLITIVVALGAPWLPLFFQAFMWFAIFVMDIVGAGILTHQIPFSASSCSTSNANWARFAGDCKSWVAYEALAWTNWALTFLLFCLILADAFSAKHKRHYLLGE
ncbi:hypothetical protein JCM10450v2_002792 [Rhodotorula kratochvilovae]